MSAHAAPTEPAPAPDFAPAPAPARPPRPGRGPGGARVRPLGLGPARGALWWPTLLTAGVLCFITFYAKGGLELESMTATEMALTLAAGLVVAGAIVLAPARRRAYGLWPVALLLAFAALSALSVVWSVQPDHSWQDSGRLFAYSGVLAAAVALVRLAPERWPALLGGIALAAVVVCAYALLTKIFPSLAPSTSFARLEEPYGYWNAIGLTAAMGAICCMWLGARRAGHALLSALAYPASGLLLLTLVLAYSRGALAALAIGLALWFCVVPLRLRSAAVLIVSALCAGAVAAWDFSNHALSAEGVALGQRAGAGHQLGALVLAMVVLLALAGIAIGFFDARRAPSPLLRRRAGALLLAIVALALLCFAGALAHSHRGFTGSISHAVEVLTNPNAKTPPNTPDRLTAVASVRARYWKEALQVFAAHPALGVGADGYQTARLRYRKETLEVKHAHGFIVQTLADLGLAGLAVALALLVAWILAARRATRPFDWRSRYTPERVGMLAMLCLVVVFGVHSFVDWTWYVPGDACVALLCAGWLAGRGPLGQHGAVAGRGPMAERGPRAGHALPGAPSASARAHTAPGRFRLLAAATAIVAALLAAWSQWQPQRSEDARQQALALLASNPGGAEAAAKQAVARDPLSAEALLTLASVQQANGHSARARATLQRAVRLQPSNPQTWVALGKYDLSSGDQRAALQELRAAIFLNPESIAPEAIARGEREAIEIHNDYIEALRDTSTAATAATASAATATGGASATAASAAPASAGTATRWHGHAL
jgi:tetratricopeptide (TPR) repeat protein